MTTDPTIQQVRTESVRRSRRRQRLAAAAAAALATLVLVVGCGTGTIGGARAERATGADDTAVAGEAARGAPAADAPSDHDADDGAGEPPDDTTEDGLDATDDSHGYPDAGDEGEMPPPDSDDDDPVELDPVDAEPTPSGPCADLPATGASLVVTPDPAVLPSGEMSGVLSVTNCSDGDIDWTAATVPSVALATQGANVLPGETADLGFTIDADAHDPGAIAVKIKVSEPGHNHYVDVFAFRPTFGKDLVPDIGLTAGEGAGGCANQCITKAWLTANFSSPNVDLEVVTNTPASIEVSVSTQAPEIEDDGSPVFPGVAPIAESGSEATQWSTTLSPLSPATKYFIVVAATDGNDHTAYRSGSFTTITPVENPGDLTAGGPEPGCAQQCITSAVLTPGADPTAKHLSVASHTPAQIQVFVSSEAPVFDGGVPSFESSDFWAASGLDYVDSWETAITGLAPGTEHHIIVQAVDANDHRAYRVGTFHTADAETTDVLITFHKIHVSHDGDSSWKNRGELSFAWGAGDATTGTRGEEKISDGTTIGFAEWKDSYVAQDVTDFLPTVFVSGSERDADGLSEFCTMGTGVHHEPGWSDSCDAKWNVASSGLVTLDGLDSMADCSAFGIDDNFAATPCTKLETVDLGGDYPRFDVIVSFHVLT